MHTGLNMKLRVTHNLSMNKVKSFPIFWYMHTHLNMKLRARHTSSMTFLTVCAESMWFTGPWLILFWEWNVHLFPRILPDQILALRLKRFTLEIAVALGLILSQIYKSIFDIADHWKSHCVIVQKLKNLCNENMYKKVDKVLDIAVLKLNICYLFFVFVRKILIRRYFKVLFNWKLEPFMKWEIWDL